MDLKGIVHPATHEQKKEPTDAMGAMTAHNNQW